MDRITTNKIVIRSFRSPAYQSQVALDTSDVQGPPPQGQIPGMDEQWFLRDAWDLRAIFTPDSGQHGGDDGAERDAWTRLAELAGRSREIGRAI